MSDEAFDPLDGRASPRAHFWFRLRYALLRLSRRFPRLVWYGDELDVRVTFSEARLPALSFRPEDGLPAAALEYLNKGALAEVERGLSEIGIRFDTGGGAGGRDWEWDYSLRGPISVRFIGRAKQPERRK